MANLEFYKDELKDKIFSIREGFISACVKKGVSNFVDGHLQEIGFKGDPSRFIDWLLEEHKESNKITLHEKYVLESICNEYKYLARDENGLLWAYIFKSHLDFRFGFLQSNIIQSFIPIY